MTEEVFRNSLHAWLFHSEDETASALSSRLFFLCRERSLYPAHIEAFQFRMHHISALCVITSEFMVMYMCADNGECVTY